MSLSHKRKICFISSSRADYDLLFPIMICFKKSKNFEFQILVTGSHLESEHGKTVNKILKDGFQIDKKIKIEVNTNKSSDINKSLGNSIIKISNALEALKPDLVFLLGDRFEIFGAAQAAMILGIPIAHMCGGDNAMGTYDNLIRHSISKMSSIHFVTNMDSKRRVIQLGEDPKRVFNHGSTCVENIKSLNYLSKNILEKKLNIRFKNNIFVCTYHPLTIKKYNWKEEFLNLMSVLEDYKDTSIIFTKANADEGGKFINIYLEKQCKKINHFYLFDSLGKEIYLNLLKQSSLAIGNSSSLIYEAPYLKTPSVDIGMRQKTRLSSSSVFRANSSAISIRKQIDNALKFKFKKIEYFYGNGNSSEKIYKTISAIKNFKELISEEFYEV